MIRSTPYATICIRFPGIDRPPRRLSCRAAQRVRVTTRLEAQSCAPSLLRCHRSDQLLECCVAADWPRYRASLARSDDAGLLRVRLPTVDTAWSPVSPPLPGRS